MKNSISHGNTVTVTVTVAVTAKQRKLKKVMQTSGMDG